MADSSASLTPEKRLLNLIENGGKSEAPSGGRLPPSAAPTSGAAPVLKEPFRLSFQDIGQFFLSLKDRFGLKTVNQVAHVFLAGLMLVTAGNAVYEMKMSGKDPLAGLEIPERKVALMNIDEENYDASKMQSSDARNVFLPFAKREEQQVAQAGSSGSAKLLEMTKTMKLTGISFNPEDKQATYCMIEDLSKNITVFLREGDQISGMKVGKILEESIELQYENEKIEIR